MGVHACSRQSTNEVDTERDKTARESRYATSFHVHGILVIILSIPDTKNVRLAPLPSEEMEEKSEKVTNVQIETCHVRVNVMHNLVLLIF